MDRVDYAFPPQRMPSYNQPGLSLPPRFQQQQHHHHHPHLNPLNTPEAHYYSPRPAIDADVLAAGVQRYIPSANRPPAGFPHSNSYISLPPGVDPATVDFRTFYPYNPSEVKHRKRTTRTQLKVLEETFKKETKPNAALRKQLASQLDMTPRGVQVWFQNRRAKEKTLAKKASSSNAKKPINLASRKDDDLNDEEDDIDCDDENAAADDVHSQNEHLTLPVNNNLGTNGSDHLNRRSSHSSSNSNSPESTSFESTPPNVPADVAPHVSVSPPAEDEENGAVSDGKTLMMNNGGRAGYPPGPWNAPSRSMSRTPTSSMGSEMGQDNSNYPGGDSFASSNLMNVPGQDPFSRRPSLPTHLGPTRLRPGYSRGPGGLSLGGSVGINGGFNPNSRRMSLDRLASHPYAHLAAQANNMVYGSGVAANRYRPTLPGTTQSTPTLTPQAHTSELPTLVDSAGGISSSGNDSHGSSSESPQLSLPSHLQQQQQQQQQQQHSSVKSSPTPEMRPELMHRQSLPGHVSVPPQFPSSPGFAQMQQPPPASAGNIPVRFPRVGQFAISARSYQPPIPGPLPNPNFSFGSVDSTVGDDNSSVTNDGGSVNGDAHLHQQLNSFQFPSVEGKEENNGLKIEMDGSNGIGQGAPVYYSDMRNINGVDPFASRFGSIASIASIAESESSATSGGYFSEAGSFDVSSNGLRDARRPSCTSQVVDMFSSMGVNGNGSSPSLQQQSREQKSSLEVPLSRNSELAFALLPDANRSPSSESVSLNQGYRSSMSSSDLSLPHSAGSSRSSLAMRLNHRLPRLDTSDKLDFMHNYDAVSETGHYSPVSSSFDQLELHGGIPNSNGSNVSLAHSVHSSNGSSGNENGGGLVQQNEAQQQRQRSPVVSFYSVGNNFSKEGQFTSSPTYLMRTSGGQENVTSYGYFN